MKILIILQLILGDGSYYNIWTAPSLDSCLKAQAVLKEKYDLYNSEDMNIVCFVSGEHEGGGRYQMEHGDLEAKI